MKICIVLSLALMLSNAVNVDSTVQSKLEACSSGGPCRQQEEPAVEVYPVYDHVPSPVSVQPVVVEDPGRGFSNRENGYCVNSAGGDVNDGVHQIHTSDCEAEECTNACLEACRNYPGFTGCETIWNQGNRGCYVHTSSAITHGNGAGNHYCWIGDQPAFTVDTSGFSGRENGYCVNSAGGDVNDGVHQIHTQDCEADQCVNACLDACRNYPGFTGCETIWNQGNRGCYVHTSYAITHGNGAGNHYCWIADVPEPPVVIDYTGFTAGYNGYCVNSADGDVNDGVHQINAEDCESGECTNACLAACRDYPGVTGCETIWNQGNQGCYAHTSFAVSHGNGAGNHMCWIGDAIDFTDPRRGFGYRANGYCVDASNNDVNDGVHQLFGDRDCEDVNCNAECLALCRDYPGFTGCEVIWGQNNRGCYVHTNPTIMLGGSQSNHYCWIRYKLHG